MKSIVLAVLLVLVASPAFAAVDITFTNGSTTSLENYVVKDGKYCTRLVFGEICYPKDQVQSITRAGDSDAGGEYGMSVMGGDHVASMNKDLSSVLGKSEAEDRAFKSQRDKEQAARSKQEEKRIKDNREHGKADWAR